MQKDILRRASGDGSTRASTLLLRGKTYNSAGNVGGCGMKGGGGGGSGGSGGGKGGGTGEIETALRQLRQYRHANKAVKRMIRTPTAVDQQRMAIAAKS